MKSLLPSFKFFTVLVCIVLAGILFSFNAFGGALINFEITDLEAPPGEKKGVGRLFADTRNSMLKFENDRDNKEQWSTMVFNGKKKVLELYDHQNKNKRIMDQQSTKEMMRKMKAYQSQFDGMMKNMTDEQRAMMQKMGRGSPSSTNMSGNAGPGQMKFVKTRRREKVLRWPCTVYEVFTGSGEKQLDMCVTDSGNIPDGKDVKKLMGQLDDFFKEIFSSMPTMDQQKNRSPFQNFNKVNGFPVKTIRFEGGKAVEITTVISVKKAEFKPAEFNPYPGYPAVGMMDGQGKMRKMRRSSRMPQGPDGIGSGVPGRMSPPPGQQIPGQVPGQVPPGFQIPGQNGQPMDLKKLLEGLQQGR